MVGCSSKKGENYPRKCFCTKEKESRVKFNPGLSTNRPSNNWALVFTKVPVLPIRPQSVIGACFVLSCLGNMLNYGISLVFWAPFSLKILLLLLFVITIKMTPWSKPFLFFVWNHLRSILGMNCGLGIICGTVQGSLGRSCKLSPPFFLTQPSAPGAHASNFWEHWKRITFRWDGLWRLRSLGEWSVTKHNYLHYLWFRKLCPFHGGF